MLVTALNRASCLVGFIQDAHVRSETGSFSCLVTMRYFGKSALLTQDSFVTWTNNTCNNYLQFFSRFCTNMQEKTSREIFLYEVIKKYFGFLTVEGILIVTHKYNKTDNSALRFLVTLNWQIIQSIRHCSY